jgi:putative transposase
LHIRRRRRKKIPVSERQPLIRPTSANEVWSMDFVFDRVAGGRVLKCLVIVDDATHESVAIVVEHTIGGDHLTRILDGICSVRGKPAVIRSDNYGPEFVGKAMLTWAHRQTYLCGSSSLANRTRTRMWSPSTADSVSTPT